MTSMDYRFARLLPAGAVTMAIAAGTVLSAPATAQGVDSGPPLATTGGLLSTRVSQGRTWQVGIGVETLADSNYRLLPTGFEESALRITPVIEGGAGLPIGRQQLYIGGLIGRDFFINKSEFNRNRWSLGAGVIWRLGARCSGVVGAETQEQLLQVDELGRFTANVQTTNTAAASANCQTATGLGFGGSVRLENASNDTPERAAFDYRSTTYAPSISYGNDTLGRFSIGASFGSVSFPRRPVVTIAGLEQDGTRNLNGRLGYSRTMGTRLQVSAGVSYLKTTPQPSAVLALDTNGQVISVPRDPFSGTGYDVSLVYQPSSRLTVNILGDRGVNSSGNVGALFTIRQGLSVNMNYKIGPSLNFGLGAARTTNDYRGSFVVPGEIQQRLSDRFERVYAKLDYSPVRLYSIGVEVAHQRRKSNPAIFDFAGTTALLRLRVNLGRG